jgi:hypothetical protein
MFFNTFDLFLLIFLIRCLKFHMFMFATPIVQSNCLSSLCNVPYFKISLQANGRFYPSNQYVDTSIR